MSKTQVSGCFVVTYLCSCEYIDTVSPFSRWLNQSTKESPWHGFTVVSGENQRGNSVADKSDTWSTQAEAGSGKEK